MADLASLGIMACVAIIIIIVIIFFVLWLFFKFLFAFFPSIVVAVIVYLVTGGNWVYAVIAFVVSALIFAAMGANRRRNRY
jgi:hypothetical protein